MAVAARAAGTAVNRNRLRRVIRESFRLHRQEMPAVDVLVTARPPASIAPNRDLFASLAALWQEIGARQ